MDVIFAGMTAFLASFISIRILKPLAIKLDLVDRPNQRKQHQGEIPLVGGIAIFIAVLATSMLWIPDSRDFNLYIIASALMVFIGVLDDKHDLSVRVRLVGQILVASIMIFGAGIYIDNLGNLLGFGTIHLGIFGIPFTYLAVLGAINAFNMIDGIDGLVGCMSIITLTSLSVLFWINGDKVMFYVPLIVAIAIVPYLVFNLGLLGKRFRKIFMGDAGSMFVGFSVVWLLAEGSQSTAPSFQPVTALWIIAVPLMDMAAVMYRRWRKGQSPFLADRDHLHHIFMRAGFSPIQSLFFISLMGVVMAAMGTLAAYAKVPSWAMFFLFLCVFCIYSYTLQHAWVLTTALRKFRAAN